jgi:hypothetical protein
MNGFETAVDTCGVFKTPRRRARHAGTWRSGLLALETEEEKLCQVLWLLKRPDYRFFDAMLAVNFRYMTYGLTPSSMLSAGLSSDLG